MEILRENGVDHPLDAASYALLLPDGVRYESASGAFILHAEGVAPDEAWLGTTAVESLIDRVVVTELRSLEGGPIRGTGTINGFFDVTFTLRAIGANAFVLRIAEAGNHTHDIAAIELTLIVEPRLAASRGKLTTAGPVVQSIANAARVCKKDVCMCSDGRRGNSVCTQFDCDRRTVSCMGPQGGTCAWIPVDGGTWMIGAIPLFLLGTALVRRPRRRVLVRP